MSGRITQKYASVLSSGTATPFLTQVYAQGLGQSNNAQRRVTQVEARVMGRMPSNEEDFADSNRVTTLWANVMIPFTPNFEWIEMVIDEIFPFDISYESIGATRFSTDVIMVDSGHDQRTSRWDQPLMEYDVAYGVRTMEHLHGLIAFFRAVRGRKYAFLYKDIVDFTSTLAVDKEARRSPAITPLDQMIGLGDHRRFRFQLVKHYPTPSGNREQVRPIYRPREGTVMIAVNGLQVSNVEIDHQRGVVTFVPNWSRTGLLNMRLEPHATVSGRWVVTALDPIFGGLASGDKMVMTGWLNPVNNTTEAMDLFVQAVGEDNRSFTFNAPDGFGEYETGRDGVNIFRHPAPTANSVITAGYEFFVPVRFDTDRLPVSLEEYGVGGAADVRLVEVRPAEIFDE